MSAALPEIPDFSDLDAFYPGSKRKRRDFTPETPKPLMEEERWDARPQVKNLHGRDVEFFTAGALAAALGRPLVTVRLWERKGYIPMAPFRLPRQIIQGREVLGRRLYTRELIEATVAAFERRGLMDKDRIEWKDHSDLSVELLEKWRDIHSRQAGS